MSELQMQELQIWGFRITNEGITNVVSRFVLFWVRVQKLGCGAAVKYAAGEFRMRKLQITNGLSRFALR
jgi:hypothetical protein